MAKIRRSSVDNMFAKKGSVQPQKKDTPKEHIDQESIIKQDEKEISIPENEHKIEDIPVTETSQIEESAKEKVSKKPTKKATSIDGLFGKKKENGKAQSVYLKKEVYDFCSGIAEDYQIGMSDVINTLILSIMNNNEEN